MGRQRLNHRTNLMTRPNRKPHPGPRSERSGRRLHVANALLLAALFLGSLAVWPDLPERVPGHIGFDGEVTRWDESSLTAWLLLPLIALATAALTYGGAALLPRHPGLFNIPDKAAFLALPADRRMPVIARMRSFLYGITALTLGVFAALQWTRYRIALGADPEPYLAFTLVAGLLIAPVALGVWLPPIGREIRRQKKQAEAAGAREP